MLAQIILAATLWNVAVDPSVERGPIRPENAVNGGPTVRFDFRNREWRHARIPMGRTHDMNHSWEFGGPHTLDVDAIFPDFDADENDPKNYDFFYTDQALDKMAECGTEPFFRLGPSIEGGPKKYHVHPPKDFAKWARICERIVLHCNAGWADGHRRGIRYWEIWNEPDLTSHALWTGDQAQFLELFKVAFRHLKGRFPDLKFGGPAFASPLAWKDVFLPFCRREKLELDFYSWHYYFTDPRKAGEKARAVRKLLDDNGFTRTESIFDEWNYVLKWGGGEWLYSRQVESAQHNQKGAAFAAAVMSECQDAAVDWAMFYDTRAYGGMNILFEPVSHRPLKGYYPFYAWSRLRCDYGTQVAATVDEPVEPGVPHGQLYATAAKDAKGGVALWVARYSNDNNVLDNRLVKIRVPKDLQGRRAVCHLTDDVHTYTEVPLDADADGALELHLVPNSFAVVELAARP